MLEDRRGILYPERLPSFHRLPAPASLAHAVHWFWIPEWQLQPGEISRQEVLPHPACNVVVGPEGVRLEGPPTRRSERVLSGTGWTVGALLKPAAVPALLPDPSRARDTEQPIAEPTLHRVVSTAMTAADLSSDARRAAASVALTDWLLSRLPSLSAEGELANALGQLLADPSITQVADLAPRLHTSTRTLQRVASRYFGLTIHSMIRRRRLQEGAKRLRADPTLSIASLASELGYSDHAHFTTDFTAVLGVSPRSFRGPEELAADS